MTDRHRITGVLTDLIGEIGATLAQETMPTWLELPDASTQPVQQPLKPEADDVAAVNDDPGLLRWRQALTPNASGGATFNPDQAALAASDVGGSVGRFFDDLAKDLSEVRGQRSVTLDDIAVLPTSPERDDRHETGVDGERYRTGKVVGVGGMGVVHAAEQVRLGRQVAVKVLRDDLPQSQRARRLVLFQQEAKLTAALDHPHIVPVHDAGSEHLVMKLLPGRTLSQAISEGRFTTDPSSLVEVIGKISDAVAYAHAHGVIHRDIKSDNVILGDFGEAWLLDWGLAVSFQTTQDGRWLAPCLDQVDGSQLCAGTPACLAPEVARAERAAIGPATDIFLLGAMLYHGLSGLMPYKASSPMEAVIAAAEHRIVPLAQVAPATPVGLVNIVERTMAHRPQARGSAATLSSALRTWLRRSAAEAAARSAFESGREMLRRAVILPRRHWERAYPIYTLAIKEFDRAVSMDGEWPQAREARNIAMWLFSRAALAGGDIFMARLLMNGQSPPAIDVRP